MLNVKQHQIFDFELKYQQAPAIALVQYFFIQINFTLVPLYNSKIFTICVLEGYLPLCQHSTCP